MDDKTSNDASKQDPPKKSKTAKPQTKPKVTASPPAPQITQAQYSALQQQLAEANEKLAAKDKPAEEPQRLDQRKFRKNTSYYSDLFKLELAKCLKWMGYTPISERNPRMDDGTVNWPDWQEVEHVHHFRTVDSKGKPQTYSNPIGNHFHEIKITRDSKDPRALPKVECISGPLQWGAVEKNGKRVKAPVSVVNDEHTHETVYIKSDELKRPDMNPEALKVIGAEAARNSTQVYDDTGRPLGNLAVQ